MAPTIIDASRAEAGRYEIVLRNDPMPSELSEALLTLARALNKMAQLMLATEEYSAAHPVLGSVMSSASHTEQAGRALQMSGQIAQPQIIGGPGGPGMGPRRMN